MPLFNWLGPGEGESLRKLYSRALTLDEWATKGLWRHILSKAFPLEKGFLVLTEAPPIQAGSLRRVDLMVERSGEDNLCPIILWGEAKKANSLGFDMAEVESQGFTAGMEHLMYDRTGRTAVWVMTVFGPNARVWAYLNEKKRCAGWTRPGRRCIPVAHFPRQLGLWQQAYISQRARQ